MGSTPWPGQAARSHMADQHGSNWKICQTYVRMPEILKAGRNEQGLVAWMCLTGGWVLSLLFLWLAHILPCRLKTVLKEAGKWGSLMSSHVLKVLHPSVIGTQGKWDRTLVGWILFASSFHFWLPIFRLNVLIYFSLSIITEEVLLLLITSLERLFHEFCYLYFSLIPSCEFRSLS